MSHDPTFPAGIHAMSDVYAEIEKRDEIISKLSADLAACRAREAVTEGATQRFADLSMELGKDRARMNFLAQLLHCEKWNDVLPDLRPDDEKYIDRRTFRHMLDAAMEKTK